MAEAEDRARKLGNRLSELEELQSESGKSIEVKYKKSIEKVTTVTKELKQVQRSLEKSETLVKELTKTIDANTKKISELENCNSRLRLLKEQAVEVAKNGSCDSKPQHDREESSRHPSDRKSSCKSPHERKASVKLYSGRKESVKSPSDRKASVKSPERKESDRSPDRRRSSQRSSPDRSRRLCKFERTGTCHNRSDCRNYHPVRTCQFYSKIGACANTDTCQLRHPKDTCFEWESAGSCRKGDSCRYRHPLELQWKRSSDAFLAQGHPEMTGENGLRQIQGRSPNQQRYHDLRGGRW